MNQVERVTYIHKDKEKTKLKVLDKMMKPKELVDSLKFKLEKFAMHRFNVEHTTKTFGNLVNNLNVNSILKIYDFSEDCTCLLPEEIQSLHCLQETASIYPIIVMRKAGNEIREDHLVFISDDKKYDVPFVEKSNEILHHHYVKEGLQINDGIEYDDGYSSHSKCIRAFSSLARRPVKTKRIFCETSHGKSKSDGLGGVVKVFGSSAVSSKRRFTRDAKELTDFFDKTLEPYYLLKVISLFETKAETTDDYRHTFSPAHRIVESHYLEIYKEINDGTLYYIDNTRKALISAFCVFGNCPVLPSTQQKKRRKNIEMFIVNHDIHQVLYELAISKLKSLTDLFYISNFLVFYAF